LVLEERIRKIAKDHNNLSGAALVNAYIKSDADKSVIRVSPDRGEQEGLASIFREVVGAFRNPSHHSFIEDITREQALQVCAFIDNLLWLLGESDVFLDRK
jgi:hypothetical protein